ncbi:hypothetical protein ODZ84_05600 [Chryseobacterium fluminis]|nr:hypothetical protein ODZ84_05600 [Chryseobacterium sp. MMS21-Ot14]
MVQYPNVYILESMNIVSGDFSIIQAELNAMEFLLNASKQWDYLINSSGEDLPLRSQDIIRQFLTVNAGEIIFSTTIRNFTDRTRCAGFRITLLN